MNMVLQILCTLSAMLTLWLIGDKKKIGFIVGLSAQVLWALLFLTTAQYIMLITPFVYGFGYLRGYIKWGAKTDIISVYKPVDRTKGQ